MTYQFQSNLPIADGDWDSGWGAEARRDVLLLQEELAQLRKLLAIPVMNWSFSNEKESICIWCNGFAPDSYDLGKLKHHPDCKLAAARIAIGEEDDG